MNDRRETGSRVDATIMQEVDTSVGAAMFTAFETRRAKEWEDVIASRSLRLLKASLH